MWNAAKVLRFSTHSRTWPVETRMIYAELWIGNHCVIGRISKFFISPFNNKSPQVRPRLIPLNNPPLTHK